MSRYAVIPAPGHYGDHATVMSTHDTVESARKHAGPGYAVYETASPQGTRELRGVLAIYQQGADGVYRIPGERA